MANVSLGRMKIRFILWIYLIAVCKRVTLVLKQLKFHEIILACSLPKYPYNGGRSLYFNLKHVFDYFICIVRPDDYA
jgi:hypothetical protein